MFSPVSLNAKLAGKLGPGGGAAATSVSSDVGLSRRQAGRPAGTVARVRSMLHRARAVLSAVNNFHPSTSSVGTHGGGSAASSPLARNGGRRVPQQSQRPNVKLEPGVAADGTVYQVTSATLSMAIRQCMWKASAMIRQLPEEEMPEAEFEAAAMEQPPRNPEVAKAAARRPRRRRLRSLRSTRSTYSYGLPDRVRAGVLVSLASRKVTVARRSTSTASSAGTGPPPATTRSALKESSAAVVQYAQQYERQLAREAQHLHGFVEPTDVQTRVRTDVSQLLKARPAGAGAGSVAAAAAAALQASKSKGDSLRRMSVTASGLSAGVAAATRRRKQVAAWRATASATATATGAGAHAAATMPNGGTKQLQEARRRASEKGAAGTHGAGTTTRLAARPPSAPKSVAVGGRTARMAQTAPGRRAGGGGV